ncbi:hypothetical protein L873DRAFT_1789850 [Choiromyces venosus 120613-1]|uniref:F-box domain-containing protein n=1 Tax=Choiromyces venosus 120613-1 TaxID=1336337 RepID=A0A3N4JPT5_9PEZI|nr:hypothetical protein L873DRAFT_1789850 [Choiromyces venosus 120613-1]
MPRRREKSIIRAGLSALLHRTRSSSSSSSTSTTSSSTTSSTKRKPTSESVLERFTKAKNVHDFLTNRPPARAVCEKEVKGKNGGRGRSDSSNSSNKRESFTVLRAQVYKKGECNDFKYSPMLAARIPVIRVDPPDDIPFELKVEELRIDNNNNNNNNNNNGVVTPPGSPVEGCGSGRRRRGGGAELRMIIPGLPPMNTTPPSPPDSPISLASPTRPPPPPPPPARKAAQEHSPFLTLSDDILLRIYTHSPTLSTAITLSETSKRLHTLYSSSALHILQKVLSRASPAAHRFLNILQTSYTAATYADYYSVATDTVRTFSSLISARCEYLCPGSAFATEEALFNVWSYCTLFTPSTSTQEEEEEEEEEEWLQASAFTKDQLLDMLKVWNCISVLLQPFLKEERLARMYGVVTTPRDAEDVEAKVLKELEGFVEGLLVRGLDTLLPIVRWGEEEHNQRYAIVVAKGLNKVRSCGGGGGRFLKEVAGGVYMRMCISEERGKGSPGLLGWGPTFEE